MADKLTHMTQDGRASMVDVGGKENTRRVARAGCVVRLASQTLKLLVTGDLPKGEALGTARIAGIQAAKRTFEFIPLCHPLLLSYVDVDFEVDREASAVKVSSEVRTTGNTGVEMEALVACQMAALTLYDMCKAVQKDITIDECRLLYKSGGKSGTYEGR
ncbi:MAG: cyclic pyranopterin monophosphate synthase MoaC [Desulfovibrionales bacterium]